MSGPILLAKGVNASPGTATGKIVFQSEEALTRVEAGEKVILVRTETGAEDVPGMRVAEGILTTSGGLTADAAIVARSLKKPCVCGCNQLSVDYANETLSAWVEGPSGRERLTLKKGDVISIDGKTGHVYSP